MNTYTYIHAIMHTYIASILTWIIKKCNSSNYLHNMYINLNKRYIDILTHNMASANEFHLYSDATVGNP